VTAQPLGGLTVTACLLRRDDGWGLRVWDEETGELHRELEGLEGSPVWALAYFLSADGQQARLVAGWYNGRLWVYDPETGSILHHLDAHTHYVTDLVCIDSSFAPLHHPRVLSALYEGTARVWDGETGELLAELHREGQMVWSVAAWKDHTGGHDRIATCRLVG
jgi:WD40 repeat protein